MNHEVSTQSACGVVVDTTRAVSHVCASKISSQRRVKIQLTVLAITITRNTNHKKDGFTKLKKKEKNTESQKNVCSTLPVDTATHNQYRRTSHDQRFNVGKFTNDVRDCAGVHEKTWRRRGIVRRSICTGKHVSIPEMRGHRKKEKKTTTVPSGN